MTPRKVSLMLLASETSFLDFLEMIHVVGKAIRLQQQRSINQTLLKTECRV